LFGTKSLELLISSYLSGLDDLLFPRFLEQFLPAQVGAVLNLGNHLGAVIVNEQMSKAFLGMEKFFYGRVLLGNIIYGIFALVVLIERPESRFYRQTGNVDGLAVRELPGGDTGGKNRQDRRTVAREGFLGFPKKIIKVVGAGLGGVAGPVSDANIHEVFTGQLFAEIGSAAWFSGSVGAERSGTGFLSASVHIGLVVIAKVDKAMASLKSSG